MVQLLSRFILCHNLPHLQSVKKENCYIDCNWLHTGSALQCIVLYCWHLGIMKWPSMSVSAFLRDLSVAGLCLIYCSYTCHLLAFCEYDISKRHVCTTMPSPHHLCHFLRFLSYFSVPLSVFFVTTCTCRELTSKHSVLSQSCNHCYTIVHWNPL